MSLNKETKPKLKCDKMLKKKPMEKNFSSVSVESFAEFQKRNFILFTLENNPKK